MATNPLMLGRIAHATTHTGFDVIRSATAVQSGLATAAQITKLDGIAALADVTGSNPPQAHVHTGDTLAAAGNSAAWVAGGDITLANGKDLRGATQFGSDLFSNGTPGGSVYCKHINQYRDGTIWNAWSRYNGTFGAKTQVNNGDIINYQQWYGYHGATGWNLAAAIHVLAREDFTGAGAAGSCMMFQVADVGDGSLSTYIALDGNGETVDVFKLLDVKKGIVMGDTKDIALNTTTGTKIGTATGQKLGFWNTTPVVQPGHVADPAAASAITATQPGSGADATTPNGAEWTAAVADLANIKAALDALKTVADGINAVFATTGLTASA